MANDLTIEFTIDEFVIINRALQYFADNRLNKAIDEGIPQPDALVAESRAATALKERLEAIQRNRRFGFPDQEKVARSAREESVKVATERLARLVAFMKFSLDSERRLAGYTSSHHLGVVTKDDTTTRIGTVFNLEQVIEDLTIITSLKGDAG